MTAGQAVPKAPIEWRPIRLIQDEGATWLEVGYSLDGVERSYQAPLLAPGGGPCTLEDVVVRLAEAVITIRAGAQEARQLWERDARAQADAQAAQEPDRRPRQPYRAVLRLEGHAVDIHDAVEQMVARLQDPEQARKAVDSVTMLAQS